MLFLGFFLLILSLVSLPGVGASEGTSWPKTGGRELSSGCKNGLYKYKGSLTLLLILVCSTLLCAPLEAGGLGGSPWLVNCESGAFDDVGDAVLGFGGILAIDTLVPAVGGTGAVSSGLRIVGASAVIPGGMEIDMLSRNR